MKGLKCTTSNCEYNEACHCTAGILSIGANASCLSKIKRANGLIEQEFVNMEASADFDYNKNEDLLIECDSVDCVYNNSRRCVSDLVNVDDTMFSTKCRTKTKRK